MITTENLSKIYRTDEVQTTALNKVSLKINEGEFVAIMGPSGCGKSTLLNILGLLDKASNGSYKFLNNEIVGTTEKTKSVLRKKNIGFIFQNFNLLPVLSAYENIEYPLLLAGVPEKTRASRVPKLLEAVGLSDKAKNLPGQLSGGQRQRVAIARALARRPRLVIADEPTANLDSHTGAAILALMRSMVERYHISFIFSSHDREVIKAADDTIFLRDGVVHGIRRKGQESAP